MNDTAGLDATNISFHRDDTQNEIRQSLVAEQSQKNWLQKFEEQHQNLSQVLYLIFSGFFMSINALQAKRLQNVATLELLCGRSFIMLVLFLLYFCFNRQYYQILHQDITQNYRLLLFTGGMAFLIGVCFFQGIRQMPLSEAITLLYSSPMFLLLFNALLLKELLSTQSKGLIVGCIVGILVLVNFGKLLGSQPDQDQFMADQTQRYIGALLMLGGALLISGTSISVKISQQQIHPVSLITVSLTLSAVLSLILIFIFSLSSLPPLTLSQIVDIIVMSIANFAAQIIITRAFMINQKTYNIQLINYLQIIFVYAYDVFIIKDLPEYTAIIGTFLILVTNVMILVNQ